MLSVSHIEGHVEEGSDVSSVVRVWVGLCAEGKHSYSFDLVAVGVDDAC